MNLKESIDHNTGFNEDRATARYTKKFKWSARVVFGMLTIMFGFLIVLLYWLLYPYDSEVISDPGPLITDEYTEDGIPIIRKDEPLEYNTNICSNGLDSIVNREAMIHGEWEDENGDLVADSDAGVLASFKLSQIQLFIQDNVCLKDFLVSIQLPNEIPTGNFYSIQNITTFKPNPIRTVQSIGETQIFLYLNDGQEIPQ